MNKNNSKISEYNEFEKSKNQTSDDNSSDDLNDNAINDVMHAVA